MDKLTGWSYTNVHTLWLLRISLDGDLDIGRGGVTDEKWKRLLLSSSKHNNYDLVKHFILIYLLLIMWCTTEEMSDCGDQNMHVWNHRMHHHVELKHPCNLPNAITSRITKDAWSYLAGWWTPSYINVPLVWAERSQTGLSKTRWGRSDYVWDAVILCSIHYTHSVFHIHTQLT